MSPVGDNNFGGYYAFRLAKGGLNMSAKGISNELRRRGMIRVVLCPSWVRTRIGGESALVSVDESVAGQQRLLDSLMLAERDRFFNYDGKELPW